MSLSDVEIRTAKADEKPRKLFDGGGLFLRIEPKGSKLWRMAFRYDGKEKTLSFGAYPLLSLSEARKRRDEAKALLASGIDPRQQKRLDKLTKAISNATTFKTIHAPQRVAPSRMAGVRSRQGNLDHSGKAHENAS